MSNDLKNKMRSLGRAFLEEVEGAKGVEFSIFFKDGTRVVYNTRDDVEVGE